jgi:GntR family transcriptional regulator
MQTNQFAYLNVYNDIRQKIRDGKYPIGSLLPPEAALCELYSVSRTTVRNAVKLLESEGYVKAQQGYGTEVLDFRTIQKLNYISSVTKTLEAKGYSVSTKSMLIDTIKPDERLAHDLRISEQTDVVRVQRVQMANKKPIAYITDYIVASLVAGIEKDLDKFVSLYRHIEKNYGITITSAIDTIKAQTADFMLAEMLGISAGSPILASHRVVYSHSVPIMVNDVLIDGNRMEFSVTVEGRIDP